MLSSPRHRFAGGLSRRSFRPTLPTEGRMFGLTLREKVTLAPTVGVRRHVQCVKNGHSI